MRAEDEARALKLALNQSAFRTSNERLRRAAASHRFGVEQRVPFVCECADEGCREIVMLSIEEYEHIRAHPTWFLLVAGHEDAEEMHERIVDAEQGYSVVEKISVAGAEAERLNPRRRTSD
jgi:formate-nitrite transporter family protein